jgi:pimeloyl-ACP methyl ester carboxylesterase
MHLAVTCSEDVPFIGPGAIEPAIAGTYLQGYRVLQQVAACRAWPQGAIPPDFHAPVTSDVPTLLVSGSYDPVTPPRFADQVAPHLSHGFQLLVPEAHHGSGGLSHPECLAAITTAFLEHGTSTGLDTSCVATMKRPPFVTDEASFAALLKSFGG